jgi:deoxyribodipyrimidine photo-lyase
MIAARRTHHSCALDHAIARAVELDRPLVVFEPRRAGYRWASDRLHAFVIDGMVDNMRAFAGAGVTRSSSPRSRSAPASWSPTSSPASSRRG